MNKKGKCLNCEIRAKGFFLSNHYWRILDWIKNSNNISNSVIVQGVSLNIYKKVVVVYINTKMTFDDFSFLPCSQAAWINLNMETKWSCQFTAFYTWKLVIWKRLVRNQNLNRNVVFIVLILINHTCSYLKGAVWNVSINTIFKN